MSAQSKAALQEAGSAGKSAMNAAAGTVNAQIDTGTLDGAAYAAQLAKGIAEIKAAQQKQLEEQLEQQAKEIAARQKAAAKANAKAEKKQEQDEQSVQAEQGVQDDENDAKKGQWTPWGEQSHVVGPVRSGGMKKPSEETAAAAGTKEEKKSLWQKIDEWGRSESPAEQQLHEELHQKAEEAEQAQADKKTKKVAELKALNRSQAKARAESRAMRETNARLLNKEKLTEAEKEEIYRRVNTWAEDPKNKETMERLKMAKNKNRVADLLEAGYTTEQLDEAEEYLRLYKKMGVGQRLEERVGKTMLGAGKTMLSAVPQAWDAGVQTVKNAKASLNDEEYRNAVGQQNAALLRMQDLEMSGEAVQRDENGNPAGYTEEYKELQKKLADAQAVMTARDSEINAPVSQDTFGYKLWEGGQKDLARSDLGLDESQKFIKGAVTSAAENIALAMINPALVLPGLSAQGAADSFGQSTQNGEAAMTGLAKGVAKGLAGYAINSVGVEQMLDTMGASGTRSTMAANIVKYLKNQSKLSGIAKSNPALYAVLMGATDNGLQSFAETWADYAIDLATNTAEPMSAEQLMMQSLQSMASGAVGGAATAVAGMGVNAGRRAAYERAQDAQDARNAQMAPENAQNVTENAQAAQNEPAAAADNIKATGDNLPPIQPATDKNATVTAPAEQAAAAPAMRNDIIALKENLEQGSEIKPRIAQMFLKQGSTEEMKQRKQENRKALAQMLGVEENEIPTTLKAAREYLAKVDASKLVMQQAKESQSPAGQNGEMQSNADAAGAEGERAGSEPVLRAVPMESVPEEMQQVAREISESTGARVEYFESDNPRALGAYENGTLSLNKNLNTKEAAQQTIVHEFTHYMEGTNTYSKMRQYIMDSRILQEAARAATGLNEPPQGMSWAEAWQQKILEDYAAAGIEADTEKEMIAKLCEKYLFYNEDAVNKICRENMSLAETVLDWVREMISRVRGATMEAELRHIERLYRKGIAEAKSRTEQENGKTEYSFAGENKERNFEKDKYYDKQIDRWQSLKEGSRIKVGIIKEKSPLNQVGFSNDTIYFDVSKLQEEMTKHGDHLSTTVMKQIPTLLNDPIVIAKANAKNTVNVFGEMATNSGEPVLVGVMLAKDRTGRYGVNKIRTVHARSDFMNLLTPDRILYLNENKNKTKNWFQVRGNDVPLEGKSFGLIKRITFEEESVKPKSKARFSLADPVEETRDLVAVHNSSVEGLMESLKLGGLPSPSIAIVKAKGGHTKYGDVSLVFDKNTIDPAAQKKNKVYGSDAWTPTKPRVDYKVNRDKARAFENEIAELSRKIAGGIFSRSGVLAARGIENETNLKLSDIIEKMTGDDTVRAAYLADQGKTLEPEKKAKEFSRKLKNEMLSSIIDHVGIENIASAVAEMEATESDEPVEKIYGSVKEVIQKDYEQKMQKFIARKGEAAVKAKVQNYMNDNWTQGRVADEVQNAWKMYQDGGKTKGEIDRIATSDKLREAVDDKMVARWAKEKLDGLLDEAGIYNGKDPFTASGHRRSFAQLHNAYTLENLVAAMNKQQSARGEGLWGATASGMQAVASPEYRSVSEIKADESRLAHMNEDEMSAALKVVDEKIEDVIGLIRKETEAHSSNSFEENDIIGGLLVENAQKKTISSIKAAFAKDGYAISQETARQILLMYRKAAKLPTEYFEAKPQRAVGFGEVKAAIVPDDAQSDFVDTLKNAGVQKVVLYKAGDEADRLNKLNELEDVRFSMEENEGTVSREEISRGRFARAAEARENGESMLRALFVEEDLAEETMRVMETVRNESWRILRDTEESQRTAGQKVLDRSANGIAWALKREYHSSADRAELKEQLIGLYADMEGKNITMEEAIGRARKIGRELVQTARPERRANTELMDAYGDAYQSLTGQVIRITDSEMQSIMHRWGSLREFRRDTGNKIRVSTEDGVPIDALWGELSETNPGKFEADTNDGDRVDAIANFVNELRPQEVQRYAGVEQETAEEIGERIIDGFVDGKVRTEKERVRKEVQKEVRRQVKKGVERLNADNYEYRQELGKEKKKIERMAERMGRKLASPTRQQHIVADADVQRVVQSIADDALAIVTGRFAGEDKLPYVGRKLVALSNSLSHLATTDHRYAGFMTVDANGKAVPVDFVRNLNDLAETMNKIHQENPSISDLDLETARKLRETLERVEHELKTADKLLSDTIGAEHRESVEKTAKQIYKEIDGARKVSTNSKSVGAKLLRALDDKNVGYALTILNPMRVARMMTNYSKDSAFVEVVDALNKGQRKMMLLKGQASAIFADVTNSQFTIGFDKNARRSKTGLGYTKADYDGFSGRNAQRLDVGFRDADTGEVVYITPAMRAELAMHLMNAHNRDRVLYGGLMVPDAEALCKGDIEKAQRLSHYVRFDISNPAAAYEIVAKVVDGMSDYENQWVKAAQRYFWDFSGKEYNKTTVQLWGYEAANVANYYPAASDDKNLHKNVAQRSQENYTVENNSNLKDRVYDATKPIALNEINRTTLKSIDTMSRFCGLALPMRDFEKIYNYNSEFTASGSSKNIKSAMNRAWNGKAGIYWENALEDMNGGRSKRKDALSRFFAKARGNYATAVLYGNASTAMKQAASFPTAAAAIGWKPLADGLANYNKEGAKTLEEINKRVATYSMRNGDGNSVYDTGDTSGAVARLVNSMPGAGWITAADDLTVKVLSTAAKAYVDQNIGSLEKGSTEYWDKVADVYADCIELTQPNNGTMQLSALSRSQNEILRGVTMFSNQRIQNLGLMWDAVADLRAQKARLKDAPNDADAKAEFSRAKEKFANTMSAMAVQSLMIGLMTAAGRALWHREDEYRDELGEITSKSLWKKIADDSLDSFMSNFIGIADIIDVGLFFIDKNYTHYDFAVPELEMINGLVTKGRNMVVAISAALENDDPEKADDLNEKMKKSVLAFAEQAGQSLGVPLVNLRKNVLGVFNGMRGIAEGNGWFGEYQYTAKNVRSMISGYMDGRYDLDGANEMLEKYCASKYGKAFGNMEKSERDKAASDMRDQIAKDWKDIYVQATDEERAELAEKLGEIRVGDRKLFTRKAMQAWVDSAEKTAQEKATKDRANRLYDDAMDGIAGQRLYKNTSEEEQIDLESGLNEAAKTAAKLEAGYMKTEELGAGERYLWNYAGKNADKWLALQAKYATVTQKSKAGTDGAVKMEAFLRALESSGYSTEEQAALLQAKGGNSKLEKAKAETRISYYRARAYGDTNGNGSLSQSEFKNYVAKSGMSRSTADEIWNMLWAPGKTGSSSPYR